MYLRLDFEAQTDRERHVLGPIFAEVISGRAQAYVLNSYSAYVISYKLYSNLLAVKIGLKFDCLMFSFLVAEDFVASFDCLDKPWLGAVVSSFAWLRIGSEYVVLKNVDIIDVAF